MLNAPTLGNLPPQAIPSTLPPTQNQLMPGPSGMFGSPPSQATTVSTLLDGYNPQYDFLCFAHTESDRNPFRSTNPPNKVGHGGPQQPGQQQLQPFGQSGEGMAPPEPPSQVKDWHSSITPDLRNHLVGKLVKVCF